MPWMIVLSDGRAWIYKDKVKSQMNFNAAIYLSESEPIWKSVKQAYLDYACILKLTVPSTFNESYKPLKDKADYHKIHG